MGAMTRRRPLSHLLLASHVGLVLLFAALLLATAVGTIRSAVEAQARAEAAVSRIHPSCGARRPNHFQP